MKNLEERLTAIETEIAQIRKANKKSDNPMDYIKTFEDACWDQNVNSLNHKFQYQASINGEDIDNSGPAFERLKVIQKALLGNNKLVWGKNTPYKYIPYFEFEEQETRDFRFSYSSCPNWPVISPGRLALNTIEKSNYFGTQFIDIWKIFVTNSCVSDI